ncbi:protein LYK2 [Tanacetum coccineum]
MKSSKSRMKKVHVYIIICVLAFALCIAIAVSAYYMIICMKRKKNMKHHNSSCNKSVDIEFQKLNLSIRTASEKKVSFESSSQMESLDDHILATTPGKRLGTMVVVENYTVEELSAATAEFSSTNLIEGSMYHGRLKGKNVAIKCTDHDTISKIRFELFNGPVRFHPNIIRLLGVCNGTDSHGLMTTARNEFLVFECAKNGSLKDWLHGGLAMKSHFIASCSCFLTWKQRIKICLDVATALQYMHQIINPCYAHRNIKSRNIFLDEEFHAKVGNFGMEEWYMAPESSLGVVTPSIDIYAFGVVLLEILSGNPPIRWRKSESHDDDSRLSEKIKIILDSGNVADDLREFMDHALGENYSLDVAMVLANLARACVDDDPLIRPSAGEVVLKLSELVVEKEEQVIVRESSCRPLVAQPSFSIKDVKGF